jgi:hypothetical protein
VPPVSSAEEKPTPPEAEGTPETPEKAEEEPTIPVFEGEDGRAAVPALSLGAGTGPGQAAG